MAVAQIGIRIKLEDLIPQIKAKNLKRIWDMLHKGFIEDENDMLNKDYRHILFSRDKDIQLDAHQTKEYLTTEFQKKDLLKESLLIPDKEILEFYKGGIETKSVSMPIESFDLSLNKDMYKELKLYQAVFILKQSSR